MSNFVIEDGVLIKYHGDDEIVEIPEGVVSIGNNAFIRMELKFSAGLGNSNVVEVKLPNTIKNIGYCAFCGCYNLKKINLPKGLEEIGPRAFEECSNLINVVIPDSVSKIGARAFCNCKNLELVKIPYGVQKIYASTFSGCKNLSSVTIPESITDIGESAFEDCAALINIDLPSSMKEIGVSSFKNCTSIKSITIPGSVSKLSESAFYGSLNLEEINLKNGLAIIENYVFFETAIKELTIPDTVVDIGPDMIAGCKNALNIYVSSKNKKFVSVDGVLYNRSMTTLIKYPQAKTGSFSVPQGIKRIGESAFCGSKLAHIVIPDSVEKIDSYAFWDCNNLKELSIPSTVKKIGDRVIRKGNIEKIENLSQASVLSSLTEPEYSNIKDGFFPNENISKLDPAQKKYAVACYLTNYNRYPDDKKEIYNEYIKKQGSKLLSDYISIQRSDLINYLLKVYSPSNRVIEKAIDLAQKNKEILAILLEYGNTHFDPMKEEEKKIRNMERNLERKEPTLTELKKVWTIKEDTFGKYISAYKGTEESIEVPKKIGDDEVIYIGEGAFGTESKAPKNLDWRKKGIKTVVVPKGIKRIGRQAFKGCEALTTITLTNDITKIDFEAFEGCKGLIAIEVEDTQFEDYKNAKSISNQAIYRCPMLKSIVIPKGIDRISSDAISLCPNLKDIKILSKRTSLGENAFPCMEGLTVHAPAGSYAEKYAKEHNINFKPIEE